MNRNCDLVIKCFPCEGDGTLPLANLSAEGIERDIYLSVDFRRIAPINPNTWTSAYCTTFCESPFSQNDADDCARRASYRCIDPPNLGSSFVDDPPFTNPNIVCQDGANFCEIAGGTVLAQSQADADAIAQSLCDYRLNNGTCSTPRGGGGGGEPVPDPDCPAETGAPTPLTLAIPVDTVVGWQPIQIPDPLTLDPWPTPADGPRYVIETHDYPPGHYTIKYFDFGLLSGIWRTEFETDPNEIWYGSGGFDLCDDENNCTVPGLPLANTEFTFLQAYTLAPDESSTAATDSRDFWLTPPTYSWDVQAEHSNTDSRLFLATSYYDGATCQAQFYENSIAGVSGRWLAVAGKPQRYHLIQVDGLIPQPRKLAVSGYNTNTIFNQFADPVAAGAWDGFIPQRITYETANPMNASWIADPNGPFGGVVLSYTSAHPTSANGRGWVLRIYSGFTIMWEGFRGVGSTPIGRFYQSAATPVGPSCLVLYDVTGKTWYPGEAPPA